MKVKILLPLIMAFKFAVAQKAEKQDLLGQWAVNGWFNEDSIVLRKPDTAKSSLIFTFGENNIFGQSTYHPTPVFQCGMGRLSLSNAKWKLNNNEINFDVQGQHFGTDKFHYKIIYTVMQGASESIILKKKTVILYEEKKFY